MDDNPGWTCLAGLLSGEASAKQLSKLIASSGYAERFEESFQYYLSQDYSNSPDISQLRNGLPALRAVSLETNAGWAQQVKPGMRSRAASRRSIRNHPEVPKNLAPREWLLERSWMRTLMAMLPALLVYRTLV